MTKLELIKEKYRLLFISLDLDWYSYLALKKLEEIEINNLK